MNYDFLRSDNKHSDKITRFQKTKDLLYYCLRCDRVWEQLPYDSVRNRGKTLSTKIYAYYEDFPTYGKKRIACPECKNNNYQQKKCG